MPLSVKKKLYMVNFKARHQFYGVSFQIYIYIFSINKVCTPKHTFLLVSHLEGSPRGMHAVIGGHEGAVLDALLIALLQEHLHMRVVLHLREQPPHQLGREHVWVRGQDRASQSQGIGHQHKLSENQEIQTK